MLIKQIIMDLKISRLTLKKWCLQESNQGHKDFQSFALPTELRHQLHKMRMQI